MSGVKNTKLFIAKITPRSKGSGEQIDPVYLSSREFLLSDIISDSGFADIRAHGILREIDGLGQDMGEVMAEDKRGSITLDTTRGTTGFDKRFYDIFERETILHQPISIYSYEIQEGVQGLLSDWEIEFTGEIKDIAIDIAAKTMTLAVESAQTFLDSPNYQVTRLNFPDASDAASGRFLPIIFGECYVPLFFIYQFDNSPASTGYVRNADFAYATNFPNANLSRDFQNGDILETLASIGNGEYRPVVIPNSIATGVSNLNVFDPNGSIDTSNTELEIRARDLNAESDLSNYLVSSAAGIYAIFDIAGGAPWLGTDLNPTVNLKIFEKSPQSGTPIPGTEKTAKATFEFLNAAFAAVTLPVSFAEFVFTHKSEGYFLGYEISDPNLPITDGKWAVQELTLTADQAILNDDSNGVVAWERILLAPKDLNIQCWAVGQIAKNILEDRNYSYLTLKHRIWDTTIASSLAYQTVQSIADITKLDLICKVEGLKTANNVLTGSSGEVISRSDHIIKLLYFLSNNYSLTGLDTSTFLPGDHSPYLAGYTEGQKSYRDIMIEVLENSASKLVPRRGSSSFALWTYGVEQDIAADISESDCTLESFRIGGESEIVNRIRVNFDRSSIPLNSTNQQQGQNNFQQSLNVEDEESIALYGIRDLNDSFTNLLYIDDPEVAQRWAEYKLARYGTERMYVTLTIPFWKNNYREIDLMDIITVSHIDNPSYFGSAPPNQEPQMTEDGEEVGDDFMLGDIWRRAKRYKMRVLGRHPRYSINEEESTITFRLLVLDNPNEKV